jgi:hypothetical protein
MWPPCWLLLEQVNIQPTLSLSKCHSRCFSRGTGTCLEFTRNSTVGGPIQSWHCIVCSCIWGNISSYALASEVRFHHVVSYIFLLYVWWLRWVCLGLSLWRNSLWLSRMMSSHLSSNLLLAQIMKQSNGLDVWFLVATSLATEKKSQLQLNLQLNCMNHDANLMV